MVECVVAAFAPRDSHVGVERGVTALVSTDYVASEKWSGILAAHPNSTVVLRGDELNITAS